MAEAKSVLIKLTSEQREAIRQGIGQDISELKLESHEGRLTPMVLEQRKTPQSTAAILE